jgi:hypothetical protein
MGLGLARGCDGAGAEARMMPMPHGTMVSSCSALSDGKLRIFFWAGFWWWEGVFTGEFAISTVFFGGVSLGF